MQKHFPGDRLFSFAVISDTHLNQDELGTDSPFEVNQLANRRLRYVIEELNTRDIEHVIHLGDVVHPVPSKRDSYAEASERFFELVRNLEHDLYIIPGNHDVGDKLMSWSPAGGVRQTYLDAWSKHFGEHYFEFHRCGIAFIGINAQLLGSGLPLESVQREWLKEKVSQFSSDRIFLFSHYPPFLLDEEENEHYDNLGDQGRQEILELIETHSIEALFAGHVHHFWYNCYKNCSCYLLPSTAFTRQDYSEMFRVSPTADFGRNDRAKLGYLLVHVYEDGHDFELIRCDGRESEGTSVAKKPICRIDSVSPRSNQFPVMGFDLRHDWQERVQIPPSGGLDEFDRKIVRNDYAMLALWEMGVQRLRIPFTDLVEDVRRKRVDELVQLGFRFTLFSTLPTDFDVLRKVFDHAHLIDSWEISGHLEESICWAGEIESMPVDHKIQLFFSPLRG